MTRYVVLAWDAPGSAEARRVALDAHFAHIGNIVDKIAVAGPLKDADGTNIGSMFVLNVDSLEAAEAVLRSDPYHDAGVWARHEVHPFLPAAGEWVGGTIW